MKSSSLLRTLAAWSAVYGALVLLHAGLLRLPYYWDEAGYYVPAALDFYHAGLLIPRSTLPNGHTPLLMVYLGAVWHVFGYRAVVTRLAMLGVALAVLAVTWRLAQRVAGRGTAIASVALLAVSPLFFAQSTLVFLDLPAALFTTWALLEVLEGNYAAFALAASLAGLSKETAVALLPVAWGFAWFRRRERRPAAWTWLLAPLLPMASWALYYHRVTGYWTGNAEYLQYNFYSSLQPLRILRSLLARLDEVFIGGFNFLLTAALVVAWRRRKTVHLAGARSLTDFYWLAAGLIAVYAAMLSCVGGAILPRYLLPVFPVFFISGVAATGSMPSWRRRALWLAAGACMVAAWYLNPPYPFPYEDNLAYADFIRLHQQAAQYLEALPGRPTILTAWPATDELRTPALGYVRAALRVAAVKNFAPDSFEHAPNFDVLYLYSRKWDPPFNLVTRWPRLQPMLLRFYHYSPPAQGSVLQERFNLHLAARFERRGQWVQIYVRKLPGPAASLPCRRPNVLKRKQELRPQ